MNEFDFAVLLAYLGATVWLGLASSSGQSTIKEYLTSGRQAPWPLVMASIVATETSTVTLISLPGFAFGNNLTFIQLALGYLVGRVIVTIYFIPLYFSRKHLTAYQFITKSFGPGVGRLTAAIFLATRNLTDGFRLFAAGLVLGSALATLPAAITTATIFLPWVEPETGLLIIAVLLLGLVTTGYTYLGGMTAVLWTDLMQLIVYTCGSVTAAFFLVDLIPGGWNEVVATASDNGKLQIFDFTWDIQLSYTFWSGLIGGTCLTIATHGTDQLMVQRYLCSRSARDAGKALLWSGAIVMTQFLLFLAIGVMLYVYHTQYNPEGLVPLSVNGSLQLDRIFPTFVVTQLPSGLRGLMVASIFASAMSTLSSSLNSSASSSLADFHLPYAKRRPPTSHHLIFARRATIIWGLIQILVAFVAINFSSVVVNEVLGIASFTNGLILGIFLLGIGGYRRHSTAYTGAIVGANVMLAVRLLTTISWQWYVLIGASVTLATGCLTDRLSNKRIPNLGNVH